MSELLVQFTDKVDLDNIYNDVQLEKSGDIIVVRPDGWAWVYRA